MIGFEIKTQKGPTLELGTIGDVEEAAYPRIKGLERRQPVMDLPYPNWVFVKDKLECPQFATSKNKTVENRREPGRTPGGIQRVEMKSARRMNPIE